MPIVWRNIMSKKTNWTRNCPKCGSEISYTTKRGMVRAIKRNRPCKSCSMSGSGNPMYGKNHTDSVKSSISKLNKGKTAWNKGLTKESDSRVMAYSLSASGVPKQRTEEGKWILRENARKQQRYMTYLKRGGLTDDEYLQKLPDLKKYRRMVRLMTSKVDTSSLENYGKAGYDLDHKFSIQEGFNRNIPPYVIADISNLEYIPSDINRSKGAKCSITQKELFNQI